MRVLIALPGLHRYNRGAETTFISIAKELSKAGNSVTLIGTGQSAGVTPYRYLKAKCIRREKFHAFPALPLLRNDCLYEELTFIPSLIRQYQPRDYDVTLTCSYPFTNWILRRPTIRGRRPPHVFITENGDWPAYSQQSEYRWFGCEGLVCTNPDFYERNKTRWRCELIPNGIDCERFRPGPDQRKRFGLPTDRSIVLMVSALIPTKRVDVGIDAVSRIPDAHLVVAGDGPSRPIINAMAEQLMPERLTLLSVPADQMPSLYQSANVFLHLSKEEAFGNVFLEAMACGLPIVAHDSSRVRWIVGENQFLIDSDNMSEITTAIKEAIKLPEGPRTEQITKAATFSWKKVGKMYHNFLKEIAALA